MTLSDLLVTHSSPTLAAMKGGSLISLRSLSGKGSFSRRELEGKGLSFLTLTNAKEEKLLLVYRRKRLWEELQDETAQRLLQMLGYPEGATLDELLTHLKKRFRSTDFPHEVGLFLSYPPLDVEGFIRNGGRGYAYSGLWKVYSDIEKAAHIQGIYEKCRQVYLRSYRRGVPLERLCITA